jgi:hypothetical protein
VEIAIIADTHMPRRGRRLPERCRARLAAAELVIHAGDLIAVGVLEELRALGPPVVAVAGNVDEAALQAMLPQTAVVECAGRRIAIIHDAGPAAGRLERMRRRFPQADAVVFGHSHIPLYECAPDGFAIFNPGSPTERRRSPRHTMGVVRDKRGSLEFEQIALD